MNIYKIVEKELNAKLGFYKLPFNPTLFDNNIIFFVNKDNNMYFNKNMLFDLFTSSSNKLLIYNFIHSEDNLWPLDFLIENKYEYSSILLDNIEIKTDHVENNIYEYFYFIDYSNKWYINTKNQYKSHIIYIKSVNDIYKDLLKIFKPTKKNIRFKEEKHEELIECCLKDKNLFLKYFNILYVNNSVYAEIEIKKYITTFNTIDDLINKHKLL